MPPLTINQGASRRDLKLSIDIPWKLYKGDKRWIATLRIDIKSRLNFKRDLPEKGQADLLLAH